MPALALTDHGNLYGAVEFLREAKAAGIVPIVGIEAYVAPGKRTERTGGGVSGQEHAFHLTLLAENAAGFRNLVRLSSLSFLEGFYYKPRIDKEILERHSEGLICLSGCASAEFSDYILHGNTAAAEQLCAWYQKVFGEDRFYVEIQDNGVGIQKECAIGALDIARRMGLPVVATSDAHYLTRADAQAHDVLLCIHTGKTIDDRTRMRFETEEFYLRSPEEMYAAMPGHDEALAASARIAERVEPHYESLGLGRRCFPSFQPPHDKTPEQYLRELCAGGRRTVRRRPRLPRCSSGSTTSCRIIDRMGFASYFLIVWDFVRYARERGIPASARGSACGALVSYVLHLSHVCPLKYDLLFERFLDPNRAEAPDIDIDLCQERRYEVIEYVRNKYGDANVAQIGTFGTLEAQGGDQGRRPGLEHPAGAGRADQQAGPEPAQHHPGGGHQGRARLEADGRGGPRGREAARLRRPAGRHEPQRRHPRRGRGDRRPAARGARAAPEAPQQRQGQGGRHHPVGDGRHRESRPAQDGLPRPAQPDHHGRGRPAHQRAASPGTRSTSTASPSTTPRPSSSSSAARPRGSSSSSRAAFATS